MPHTLSSKPRSRVLSFDADGCLFRMSYLRESNCTRDPAPFNKELFTQSNIELLTQLNSENAQYGRLITTVGSARQSHGLDRENMRMDREDPDGKIYHAPSFFPAIEAVNAFFERSTLDRFLTADLFGTLPKGGHLPSGTSFARAMDPACAKHAETKVDISKILLLYVQMHRNALAHPDEEFDFDFFDDREDILGWINDFYTQHPELIPSNLTLRLHQYTGTIPTKDRKPITGKGIIDNNYHLTVKSLFDQLEQVSSKNAAVGGINAALYLHRIQLPQPQTEPDTRPILVQSFDADGCLYNPSFMNPKVVPNSIRPIIRHNQDLLKTILQRKLDYKKIVTMVGSGRQSQPHDRLYSETTGTPSFFPEIEAWSDYVGSELDPTLLADYPKDLAEGTSFERAKDPSCTEHQGACLDRSKGVQTFAQMQKMAVAYPFDQIIYQLYDDNDNVLADLYKYYDTNRTLIPKNVTLQLMHYAGGTTSCLGTLKGTGSIDTDYKNSVRRLMRMMDLNPNHKLTDLDPFIMFSEKLRTAAVDPDVQLSSSSKAHEVSSSSMSEQPPIPLSSAQLAAMPAPEGLCVYSFDFDGCLFNDEYMHKAGGDTKKVINFNQALLDQLAKEGTNFKKRVVLVGSARQSQYLDKYCSDKYKSGSCFKAIPHVSRHLNAELDTFLLADLFENQEDGLAFVLATTEGYQDLHPNTRVDESKVLLLYAQMHKMALANPRVPITFKFYDDTTDILNWLHDFYNGNTELIPSNVSLELFQYKGGEAIPAGTIQGIGRSDPAYKAWVKDTAQEVSPSPPNDYYAIFNVAQSYIEEAPAPLLPTPDLDVLGEPPAIPIAVEITPTPLAEISVPQTLSQPKNFVIPEELPSLQPLPEIIAVTPVVLVAQPERQSAVFIPTLQPSEVLIQNASAFPLSQVTLNIPACEDPALVELPAPEHTPQNSETLTLQIVAGFIQVLGILAVALAFTVLNAATFGTVGLVVAGVGVAAMLVSVGLFAASCSSKNPVPSTVERSVSAANVIPSAAEGPPSVYRELSSVFPA